MLSECRGVVPVLRQCGLYKGPKLGLSIYIHQRVEHERVPNIQAFADYEVKANLRSNYIP